MIPFLIQILGVVGAAAVLRALLSRLDVALGFPQVVAIAVLLFVIPVSAVNMRGEWKVLDTHRERTDGLSASAAHETCTGVGVDQHFLGFVGSRIPVGERFYFESETMTGAGEYCIRFLLLPRVQVKNPDDVRYLIFWDPPSNRTLEAATRRGARILRWDRTKKIARFP